ncbi:hypothetical protein GCAAIG_05685 [Candidatus Electronema halotolerans]
MSINAIAKDFENAITVGLPERQGGGPDSDSAITDHAPNFAEHAAGIHHHL